MKATIKQIEIEGAKHPFILNILALRNFSKIHGIKRPAEIGEYFGQYDFNNPEWEALDMIANLVVCGLDEGARKEEKEQPYSSDQVLEILANDPDLISAVFENFAETVEVENEGKPTTTEATIKG